MSKKPAPPPGPSPLDKRLKAIADRKPLEADAYETVSTSHRRPTRTPTYKPAFLILAGGEKLPVVIKNLSDTGAKVEFFQNRELTGQMRLVEQSIDLNVIVEIAWQKDGVIGLTINR